MIKSYIVDSTFNNMRFDRWLRLKLGKVPQGLIEKNLRSGKIKINKKKVKSSFKVKTNQKGGSLNKYLAVSLFETGRLESWGGGVLNADKGHLDLPGMPERVADAIRRGRECNRDVMYGIDYFQYKNHPIDEVQKTLNI